MNSINLLGISKDSITVIFDSFRENMSINFFNIYLNIDIDITPFTPIKDEKYKILNVGNTPKKNESVFFGAAGPKNKQAIYNSFKKHINKSQYINLIYKNSSISLSSKMSNGILVGQNVVIDAQSKIGFGVFIKRGCLLGHHNTIGDFTDINPGVIISGKVNIGKNCVIGSGAIIRDNIQIGDNTIIGMGSVVTKNIPANSVAYGNPCKVVRENK